MRIRISSLLILILILALTTQCANEVDVEAEKSELKKVIDQFTQTLVNEDIETFSRIMAHDDDMVTFGTDAAEHWIGWEPLKEDVQKMFDSADYSKISIREQVIKISKSGDVAWFSEILDFQVEVQGEQVNNPGIRFTGVLEKREGNWIIVQFHNSMPVAGQVVEY